MKTESYNNTHLYHTNTLYPHPPHTNTYIHTRTHTHEELGSDLPVHALTQLSKLNRLSLVHCNFTQTSLIELIDSFELLVPR